MEFYGNPIMQEVCCTQVNPIQRKQVRDKLFSVPGSLLIKTILAKSQVKGKGIVVCPDNILIKQEYGQKCQQKVKFPGDSALVHFWERTLALEAAETAASIGKPSSVTRMI